MKVEENAGKIKILRKESDKRRKDLDLQCGVIVEELQEEIASLQEKTLGGNKKKRAKGMKMVTLI